MRRHIIFLIFLTTIFCLLIPGAHAGAASEYEIHVANEIWKAVKYFNPYGETQSIMYISPDGTMFDEDSFRKVARKKSESHRIESGLIETIQLLSPETMVKVIIMLRNQPYGAIKEKVRGKYKLQIEERQNLAELMKDGYGSEEREKTLKEIKTINDKINIEAYTKAKKMIELEHKSDPFFSEGRQLPLR